MNDPAGDAVARYDEYTAEKLRGSTRTLIGVAKITASLLGVLPLAYLYGFQKTQSYFRVFDAEWLVFLVPPSYLLRNGSAMLQAAVWIVLLLVWEAATYRPPNSDKTRLPKNIKIAASVLFVLFWILLYASVFASTLDPFITSATAAFVVGKLAGFLVTTYAVVTVWVVVISVRDAGNKISVRLALVILPALLLFYLVPGAVGRAEGRLQKGPDSLLSFAKLRDGSEGRLLYASDSHLYLFDPSKDGIVVVDSTGSLIGKAGEATVTPRRITSQRIETTMSPTAARTPKP